MFVTFDNVNNCVSAVFSLYFFVLLLIVILGFRKKIIKDFTYNTIICIKLRKQNILRP